MKKEVTRKQMDSVIINKWAGYRFPRLINTSNTTNMMNNDLTE
jgi:hypothetical protein